MKGSPKTWDQKRRKSTIAELPARLITKRPPAPKTFTPEMRATWKQTADDLILMGCFTTQSLIPLETYCYAIANMRKANRDKATNVSARTAANKECRVAAETLGLTPASHSKLKKPAAAGTDNKEDQMFAEIVA